MAINDLLNAPHDDNSWNVYAFNLKNQATITRQAIQTQSNGADRLFEYQLFPVPFNEINDWLERVQQTLDDINSALNLQANDVTDVDFTNPQKTQAWTYNLWQQFSSAAVALGI